MMESWKLHPNDPALPSLPMLPQELICLILFRVPVKSLIRFKCVSKLWKTLITEPQFVKGHLQTTAVDPNMTHQRLVSSIFHLNDREIVSFSMQSLFQNPSSEPKSFGMSDNFRILGSCNGLLCLGYGLGYHDKPYVILCNPNIRSKSKTYPISVRRREWLTHYGFGYDHVNDSYKLLVAEKKNHEIVTKVYTFGTNGNWTLIQNFPIPNIYPSNWQGKFVSNSLNWIARKGLGNYDELVVILSFDLAMETYGEVLLPCEDGVEKRKMPKMPKAALDVLRDCLCFSFYDSKKDCFVVWLMKKYGVQDSWTKLVILPGYVIYKGLNCIRPLCIFENGIVLMHNRLSNSVLYKSNDGSVSNISMGDNIGLELQIHYESLVPVPC